MGRYAERTQVAPESSRVEIERILVRYGASAFHYGWDNDRAVVGFSLDGRFFKITMSLPPKENFERTPERRTLRAPKAAHAAWEQACRQRWRALALWIKAVLEAAESGIVTIEEALLPFLVLPDRSTVKEWLLPQVAQAYESGAMPTKLLPLLTNLNQT